MFKTHSTHSRKRLFTCNCLNSSFVRKIKLLLLYLFILILKIVCHIGHPSKTLLDIALNAYALPLSLIDCSTLLPGIWIVYAIYITLNSYAYSHHSEQCNQCSFPSITLKYRFLLIAECKSGFEKQWNVWDSSVAVDENIFFIIRTNLRVIYS